MTEAPPGGQTQQKVSKRRHHFLLRKNVLIKCCITFTVKTKMQRTETKPLAIVCIYSDSAAVNDVIK